MTFVWNPQKRRYEDSKGNPIPPAEVRRYIEEYIDANKKEVDSETKKLFHGLASAALILRFFNRFRDQVKEMHGTAGVIAYGGEDQLSVERWERIGEKIASEYEYLNGFELAVNESRVVADGIVESLSPLAERNVIEKAVLSNVPSELAPVLESIVQVPVAPQPAWATMIWGDIDNRAKSYCDAVYATHENNVKAREIDAGVLSGRRVHEDDNNVCEDCINAASEEYVPLGDLLDIGESICTVNCRCIIEFDYHGIEPLQIDRAAYV